LWFNNIIEIGIIHWRNVMERVETVGLALQDTWEHGTCFGCGPANPVGLQLKSYWAEDENVVVATYYPKPEHNSGIENVMYGGLIASLIDCHSMWTAIATIYREAGRSFREEPHIWYVTGELNVRYLKPTPLDQPIILKAWVEKSEGRKAQVRCELGIEGKITAEASVIAIRVEG
jgi:acyl-coenzyme A thioesterase PaaI-like protein